MSTVTLLSGATSAATGGTSKAFTTDGVAVANGQHFTDFSGTDFRVRPSITLKNRPAVYNKATGKWKKGKRELTLTHPKVLADLSIEYPLFRIEIEDHPEMTIAELILLIANGVQMAYDAELTAFCQYGSQI